MINTIISKRLNILINVILISNILFYSYLIYLGISSYLSIPENIFTESVNDSPMGFIIMLFLGFEILLSLFFFIIITIGFNLRKTWVSKCSIVSLILIPYSIYIKPIFYSLNNPAYIIDFSIGSISLILVLLYLLSVIYIIKISNNYKRQYESL